MWGVAVGEGVARGRVAIAIMEEVRQQVTFITIFEPGSNLHYRGDTLSL